MSTTPKMYDSTRPWLIPSDAEVIAAYANGRFAADFAQLQKQFPKARILQIDVLGTDPDASVKDIEPGDMNPGDAARVVDDRHQAHPGALTRLYCDQSEWPAVKLSVATLADEVRDCVRYWIADPTGIPHFVPGSDATQYEFGTSYDTSVYNPATFS